MKNKKEADGMGFINNPDQAYDKPLGARQYFGDAMTVVSANIIINIVGMLIYFYTDIMGIAVGLVSTAILVSRLADAFTDIGMGVIVDRTKSKYGKARPWLIRSALPALVSIILIFTVPTEVSLTFKLLYVALTNIFLIAVVYTAIMVPSGSLLSLETKNTHERAKMGIWRLVFAYAAGLSVSALMIPAANLLGGDQRAWIIISLIYGIISLGTLVAAFFLIRETNYVKPDKKEEKIPALTGLRLLFRNKYWVIALAVNILIQIVYSLGGVEAYYVKYIFGDENLMAVIGLTRLAFVSVGFILSGLFMKKLGKRNIILAGVVFCIAGCVLRAMNPYFFELNLISIGMVTMGGVPLLAVIGAMVADTIEYGEWKTGKRMVGLTCSTNSFGGKLGSALFGGITGWLLAWSGYDGMLAVQTQTANQMIMLLNIYVPLVGYVIIFALMIFYKLDMDYDQIMAELSQRRK